MDSSVARTRWARVVPRVRPDDGAAGVHVPVGRAQAHEGRHKVDAARVGHLAAPASRSPPRSDDAQPVAQPLDGRPGDEDAALQRVGGRAPKPPGNGGEQAALGLGPAGRRCSAAGSSRCRRCSWPSRAGSRPDRRAPPAGRRRRRRSGSRRPGSPGRSRRRPGWKAATAGSMARGMSSSARISSSQSPERMLKSMVRLALEKSVTCTRPPVSRQMRKVSTVPKSTSPRAARCAQAGHVVQEPLELGARKVGVQHQAGLLADHVRKPALPSDHRTSPRCAGTARRWRCRRARRSPGPTPPWSPAGW